MAQKSLIEELPRILKEGKEEAAKLLERLSDPVKISLQTNELVLPAKDVDGLFKGRRSRLNTIAMCSDSSVRDYSKASR